MKADERRENCKSYQDKVDRLVKQIDGNGKPGLIDDTTQIKVKQGKIDTKINILTWLQSITAVAMVSGAIKIIFFVS